MAHTFATPSPPDHRATHRIEGGQTAPRESAAARTGVRGRAGWRRGPTSRTLSGTMRRGRPHSHRPLIGIVTHELRAEGEDAWAPRELIAAAGGVAAPALRLAA
jgi:hypothetical protein